MRGTECWTDHHLIRSKFQLKIRPHYTKQQPRRKLDISGLQSSDALASYRRKLAENLPAPQTNPPCSSTLNIECAWVNLSSAIHTAASESLGLTKKHHQDWFDSNSAEIQHLLEAKRKAYTSHISNPQSSSLLSWWKAIRAETQRQLRTMENE
ncbi:hypothetical protein AAFF_G00163270 [Aldrovandia affinis]|uniref:Uncharacterized protein n=1 Tax=Aldrovandia affinis TaxID=143900 RepID=A0AAD7SZ87_9TELE|nr:hypothetical protein AAFF_G00163270 [Aldrovandia affinis]